MGAISASMAIKHDLASVIMGRERLAYSQWGHESRILKPAPVSKKASVSGDATTFPGGRGSVPCSGTTVPCSAQNIPCSTR